MTEQSEYTVITYSYCDKRVVSYLYRTDLSPLQEYTIYRAVCHHCGNSFNYKDNLDNTSRIRPNCLGVINSYKQVAVDNTLFWQYSKGKYIALHPKCKEILETAPEI